MASSSHKHHPAALIYITVYLACVAGVRRGRGWELGRETAREGGGRREEGNLSPSRALARLNSPFRFNFNACHAGYRLFDSVIIGSCRVEVGEGEIRKDRGGVIN